MSNPDAGSPSSDRSEEPPLPDPPTGRSTLGPDLDAFEGEVARRAAAWSGSAESFLKDFARILTPGSRMPPPIPPVDRPSRDLGRAPLPFLFGVTGHRDLRADDVDALEHEVAAIFERFRARRVHTPIALLSPLARGADRLVAEVALRFGARLIVPLPFPKADYEEELRKDGGEASLRQFRELYDRADRAFVVDDHFGPPEPKLDPKDAGYLRVGRYVALNCQILIGLWDGHDDGEAAGTCRIIEAKRGGLPRRFEPGRSLLDSPEIGPVFLVRTRRAVHRPTELVGPPITVEKYTPPPPASANPTPFDWAAEAKTPADLKARKPFDRIAKLIDTFNRDALDPRKNDPVKRAENRGYVFPGSSSKTVPDEPLPDVARDLASEAEAASRSEAAGERPRKSPLLATLDLYATSDTLAIHFRRKSNLWLIVLLALGFVVTCLFQAHIYFRNAYPFKVASGPGTPWYFAPIGPYLDADPMNIVFLAPYDILYLGTAALLYVLFFVARFRHDQERHLDYRAVAEGLRVQFFWRLAGVKEARASDYYLRRQMGELDWIRIAIRVVDVLDGGPEDLPKDDAGALARFRLVRKLWLEDQEKYFIGVLAPSADSAPSMPADRAAIPRSQGATGGPSTGGPELRLVGTAKARSEEAKRRTSKRLSLILLYLAGPVFVLARAWAPAQHPLIITIILGTAALVLFGLYARIMAFSEHAKQYTRMGALFHQARLALDNLLTRPQPDVGVGDRLLHELGEEALAENGDWVLLHRDRPQELPKI